MNIKYFTDTDTALIEFSTKPVVETREVNEDIYVDLDEAGRAVSITIEHAREAAETKKMSFQEITAGKSAPVALLGSYNP